MTRPRCRGRCSISPTSRSVSRTPPAPPPPFSAALILSYTLPSSRPLPPSLRPTHGDERKSKQASRHTSTVARTHARRRRHTRGTMSPWEMYDTPAITALFRADKGAPLLLLLSLFLPFLHPLHLLIHSAQIRGYFLLLLLLPNQLQKKTVVLHQPADLATLSRGQTEVRQSPKLSYDIMAAIGM